MRKLICVLDGFCSGTSIYLGRQTVGYILLIGHYLSCKRSDLKTFELTVEQRFCYCRCFVQLFGKITSDAVKCRCTHERESVRCVDLRQSKAVMSHGLADLGLEHSCHSLLVVGFLCQVREDICSLASVFRCGSSMQTPETVLVNEVQCHVDCNLSCAGLPFNLLLECSVDVAIKYCTGKKCRKYLASDGVTRADISAEAFHLALA